MSVLFKKVVHEPYIFTQEENQHIFKQDLISWRHQVFNMKEIQESNSKFIKVRCPKCKNEQITYGKSSSAVNCLVCSKDLLEPTGGKSKIKARVLEVLE